MASAILDSSSIARLVAGIQNGEDDAAGELVRRYEPMLRRVLRVTGVIRRLQNQLESQDLVQSVFVRVIEAIRRNDVQFQDEAALEGYLKAIGTNRLRDHLRRRQAQRRDARRTLAGEAAQLAQQASTAEGPARLAEVREELARVENCTAPAALAVLWERVHGTDWQELASQCRTTPEALRKRRERVRQRIRQDLSAE